MRDLDRREFLAGVAGGVAAAAAPVGATTSGEAPSSATAPASASGLGEPEFRPLPVGAIRPAGWLATQLQLQAAGLTGQLADFWPDIKDSSWIGRQG